MADFSRVKIFFHGEMAIMWFESFLAVLVITAGLVFVIAVVGWLVLSD